MPGASRLAAGLNNAAANPDWISRSECMGRAPFPVGWAPLRENVFGLARFVEQRVERRNVGIPFDQSRPGADAAERFAVQIPHRPAYAIAMRIDQAQTIAVVPGEMNLTHALGWDRIQIAQRVETVVDRAHIYVVDVEQKTASGPACDLAEEIPLVETGGGELQVARNVLDQDLAREKVLRAPDVAAYDVERLLGVGKR